MTAYYNEFDPFAAQWLRNLIDAGHIAPGVVDDRSITDVTASDLAGFTQCHFFAGIGGWSYALRLAGIPDDFPCWTGSPPCQPFSVAGKQLGQLDERHLAPTFMRLVDQCRPPVLFGEQVAAAIGKHWLDDLFTELERQNYACGAAVLPAASVGAPHKRDRLFFGARLVVHANDQQQSTTGYSARPPVINGAGNPFSSVADAAGIGRKWRRTSETGDESGTKQRPERFCDVGCSMADTDDARPQGRGGVPERSDQQPAGASGVAGGMAYGNDDRQLPGCGRGGGGQSSGTGNNAGRDGEIDATSAHYSVWSDADWLGCRDGKFRPVESGTFPLVDGISNIMDDLRTLEISVINEIEHHANTCKTDTRQILSALRDALQQEASRQTQRFGMLFKLYAPEILLSFVLCISAARESRTNGSCIKEANKQHCREILRMLRLWGKFSSSPRRWKSYEPSPRELADPLFTLSLILARHVEAYWVKSLQAHAASNRVGMLRGFGNAIVPQVAAEFVTAFMWCL